MTAPATNDTPAEFRSWHCEPFGAPRASSEVNQVANFYRVECLTAFGTGRCDGNVEASAATSPVELKRAA